MFLSCSANLALVDERAAADSAPQVNWTTCWMNFTACCRLRRGPHPRQAQDLGTWSICLELLTLAVWSIGSCFKLTASTSTPPKKEMKSRRQQLSQLTLPLASSDHLRSSGPIAWE